MIIAHKNQAKRLKISKTMTAYEYPVMDTAIHGAIIEINGRYPEKGRVVNEKVTELGFILEGSGKIVIEDKEINFKKDDQILIKPKQRYYWNGKATLFMPCAPTWYPEQHKQVE
jgi:mannose-6-phosphate isomerase-like protein (cupin superfamily)